MADFKVIPAVALTHNYLANNGVLPLLAKVRILHSPWMAMLKVSRASVAKNLEVEIGNIKMTETAALAVPHLKGRITRYHYHSSLAAHEATAYGNEEDLTK
ncbi:hypothetical protein [Pseudomonas canadensis]|uniref:hypothetical protein n=1 Tax=Pseudomonas canadensis TaxID=915099 RepID=UPI003B9E4434